MDTYGTGVRFPPPPPKPTAGVIRIDQCEDRVEFTVLTYLIRSKLIDANSNYAPAMAIAA